MDALVALYATHDIFGAAVHHVAIQRVVADRKILCMT